MVQASKITAILDQHVQGGTPIIGKIVVCVGSGDSRLGARGTFHISASNARRATFYILTNTVVDVLSRGRTYLSRDPAARALRVG